MSHFRRFSCCQARHAILDNTITQAQRPRFQVPEVSPDVLKLAREVQRKYADLDLDLADAINVTLAADYRTGAILTLDRRGFRAIRLALIDCRYRL